jgi:hypothetical protein
VREARKRGDTAFPGKNEGFIGCGRLVEERRRIRKRGTTRFGIPARSY